MTTAQAIAERADARENRIIEAIDEAQHECAEALERLVSVLCDEGVIRIHRTWPASTERKLIREAGAKAALVSVLTNDWMGELPIGCAILESARTAMNGGAQ